MVQWEGHLRGVWHHVSKDNLHELVLQNLEFRGQLHSRPLSHMKNQVGSAKRKKVQNLRQLFQAFGPHQQGAAQSLTAVIYTVCT